MLLGRSDIVLVDPRERAERERHGTIPGALHAPYPALQENIAVGGVLHELVAATSIIPSFLSRDSNGLK